MHCYPGEEELNDANGFFWPVASPAKVIVVVQRWAGAPKKWHSCVYYCIKNHMCVGGLRAAPG